MAISGTAAVGGVADPTGGAPSGANFNAALSNAAAAPAGGLTPQEKQLIENAGATVVGMLMVGQLNPLDAVQS